MLQKAGTGKHCSHDFSRALRSYKKDSPMERGFNGFHHCFTRTFHGSVANHPLRIKQIQYYHDGWAMGARMA
jgi:hypothetical protein